ncbi:MAG: hypothetical protein ACPGK3_09845, partial [Paracoccaceae bacterium]
GIPNTVAEKDSRAAKHSGNELKRPKFVALIVTSSTDPVSSITIKANILLSFTALKEYLYVGALART